MWTGNVQAMGSYKNWAPGEPNNANGNEHCLEMDMGGQYHWNDNNCENRFNFICEMPYESCILIYSELLFVAFFSVVNSTSSVKYRINQILPLSFLNCILENEFKNIVV